MLRAWRLPFGLASASALSIGHASGWDRHEAWQLLCSASRTGRLLAWAATTEAQRAMITLSATTDDERAVEMAQWRHNAAQQLRQVCLRAEV